MVRCTRLETNPSVFNFLFWILLKGFCMIIYTFGKRTLVYSLRKYVYLFIFFLYFIIFFYIYFYFVYFYTIFCIFYFYLSKFLDHWKRKWKNKPRWQLFSADFWVFVQSNMPFERDLQYNCVCWVFHPFWFSFIFRILNFSVKRIRIIFTNINSTVQTKINQSAGAVCAKNFCSLNTPL